MPIHESPVIDYLDVAYQAQTGEWLTLNNQATAVDVQRGGKRSGVSNKIDVGTATVQLYGELDVDSSAALRPNTPVRIATRDGKPGLTLYKMPAPYVSDSAWIRSSIGGYTLTPAVQSRPALGDVPASNKFSYGFSSSATGSNPFMSTLAYRMIYGNQFLPGRRYRVSARANDLTAENNVPIRLVVSSNGNPDYPLLVEGKPRAINSNTYSAVPSVEFVMPQALTSTYINIGFGMTRTLPMASGVAGTFMGVYFSDFVIEQLPQEPSSVFTGRLADLTQKSELNKADGKVRTFTTILATDAVQVHANTPRYGAVVENGGLFEPWENRINRLAASSQAPIEVPTPQTERVVYAIRGGTADGWDNIETVQTGWAFGNAESAVPASVWPQRWSLHNSYRRSGASAVMAAGSLGISRTFNGLTAGATYRMNANATVIVNTTTIDASLRIGVAGLGNGVATTVPNAPTGTPLAAYAFTATGTTHTIQVTNAASVTLVNGAEIEWQINALTLTQTGVGSPYRLQDTVSESSLAAHFDLACNSVGGHWWVDSKGITRFRKYLEAQTLKGTWTDNSSRAWRDVPGSDLIIRRNLYTNPNFEGASLGTYTPVNCTAAFSTVWSQNGGRSLRVAPNSPSATGSAIRLGSTSLVNYGLQPGKTYTLSAYVNTQTAQIGSVAWAARRLEVYMGWGAGNSSGSSSDQGPTVGTGRVSITFTVPSDVTYVYFHLVNGATSVASNYVYWDSLLLEETAQIRDYFDGSTVTGDPRFSTAWTGTADASVSTLTEHVQAHRERVPAQFQYVDVNTAFDTRNLVTALTIEQKGRKVDGEGKDSADDTSTVFYDEPAVIRWGVRSDTLTTALYSGQGFESALELRSEEIFTQYSNSQRTITGFRWNAQEDVAAALALDIYDAIRVERGPLPVSGRIIGIKHEIRPNRHMVDITLTDVTSGVTWDELNLAVGTRTWDQVNAAVGTRTWAQLNADPLGPFSL